MTAWIRSSHCSGGGCLELCYQRASSCGSMNCVEIAHGGGEVWVRDSKNLDQPPQRYPATEFAAFLNAVKAGEFTAG